MDIAVIGGTGLIGSRLVEVLRTAGHAAVPHARSTGLDLVGGRGWPSRWRGPTWW